MYIVYEINGELSTTSKVNGYRPLAIASLQKVVTSLFLAGFCSNFHSKNTRVIANLTRKRSIDGAKLHSSLVNLTRNMTQSWANLTSLFFKSAESWPISGSSLTRNGVWPQWTLSGSSLTRVFWECSMIYPKRLNLTKEVTWHQGFAFIYGIDIDLLIS